LIETHRYEDGEEYAGEKFPLFIRAVRQLAEKYWDVRLAHEDPEDNDYNGCDNGLCAWCELEPDILELIHRG
jgi:hypothetical protein